MPDEAPPPAPQTPSTQGGREQLLADDGTIDIPEKEKGLTFDKDKDIDKYGQNEIDDILKMFG